MSTKAYYHPRDIEIDLADLPAALYTEIASLHGHITKSPPVLTCMGNGEPMYVYRHPTGRYFAKHYPNGNSGALSHGHAIATISDAHRRQADYCRRAAETHGLPAALEVSTGAGTRLDVAIYGIIKTGIEIQRSGLSRAAAKARAAKSMQANWPTAWVTDSQRDPDWADHVPTARLQTRGGWNERLPDPETARIIIGEFTRYRDKQSITGWTYQRRPKTIVLDQLAYLMPVGEIVPVATGTLGQVSLAFKSAIDVIDTCAGRAGASEWKPSCATPRIKEEKQSTTSVICRKHANLITACYYCGEPVAAVFKVDAHYDCARKYGTQVVTSRRA